MEYFRDDAVVIQADPLDASGIGRGKEAISVELVDNNAILYCYLSGVLSTTAAFPRSDAYAMELT